MSMSLSLSLSLMSRLPGQSAPSSQYIYPGAAWSGTEGSGWPGGVGEPTPNSGTRAQADARTGPMPITMLMQPQFRVFTADDYIDVFGVFSADLGSQQCAKIHMEGRTLTVGALTSVSRTDARTGSAVTEWVYRFPVKASEFTTEGPVRVYIEHVPTNPSYTSRIEGPYVYHRYNQKYEVTYTVTSAGSGDLDAALLAARTDIQNGLRVQILVQNNGPFTLSQTCAADTPRKVWTVIEADTGYTPVLSRAAASSTPWRVHCNNLWIKGLKLDRQNIYNAFYLEDSVGYYHRVYEAMEFMDSDGRYGLYNGKLKTGFQRDLGGDHGTKAAYDPSFFQEAWFIDCYFHDLGGLPKYGHRRNCVYETICGDIMSASKSIYNVTITDANNIPGRQGIDVFELNYSGAAATATCAYNGSNAITLAIAGDPSSPYNVPIGADTSATTGKASEVVTAINALGIAGLLCQGPGGGAIDDTRAAVEMEKSVGNGAVPNFGGWSATNIKGTTFTVCTAFDLHGDVCQQSNGNCFHNVIQVNVLATGLQGYQGIFTPFYDMPFSDVAYINCLYDTDYAENYNSHPYGTNWNSAGTTLLHTRDTDHHLFYYLCIPDQDMEVSSGAVYSNSHWVGLISKDMYKFPSSQADPSGQVCAGLFKTVNVRSTPAFLGVTYALNSDLFVDWPNGSRRAKASGPLDASGASVVPFDITGAARAATSPYSPYATAA